MIASLRVRRWSLAQRLSLLLFTVLTVIVTTFGVTAYREIQLVTRTSALDRLTGVARESALGAGRNMATRVAALARSVADPAVAQAAVGSGPVTSEVASAFSAQRGPADSTLLGRALLRRDGTPIVADAPHRAEDSAAAMRVLAQVLQQDSAVLGDLYLVDSTPHLVAGAPVRLKGRAVGAAVWWFRLGRSPNAEKVISNLTGTPTHVLFTDSAGRLWLNTNQRAVTPPFARAQLDSVANGPATLLRTAAGNPVFASVEDVPGTPLRVVMLQGEGLMMARPRALGMRLGTIALALILLSTAAVWWISRQMHRDLEAQNAALQDANAAKARFLGVMSHELRTPLNAIAGHAELIALGVHGPITPEQEHALTRIQRNKEQLLHLVNDLLFFARLDSQPLPMAREPVPLQEQFDALTENLRHEFARKHVALVVHPSDAVLVGDSVRVQQVLVNLVTNAWRFTDAGGRVEVRADTHGTRCRIEVRDTGVGIAPEDLPHVFDPFVQVDGSLTPRSGGAGLGLTIVRTLVHAMGGEVAAESTPKKGSTFRCWLPCVPRPCPAPVDPISLSGSGPADSAVPENSRTLT